jgi:hypothetical protein
MRTTLLLEDLVKIVAEDLLKSIRKPYYERGCIQLKTRDDQGQGPLIKGDCEEYVVLTDEVLTREVSGWRSRNACVAGATAVVAFAIIGTIVATGSATMRQPSVGASASAMYAWLHRLRLQVSDDHPDASHEVFLAFQTASMCTYRGDTCNCGNWL